MRFQKLRITLIRWIVRWIIVPLAGRGVQVIRQDARSGGLHHAPMCGANHYHHTRPITGRCTCGAVKYWREQNKQTRTDMALLTHACASLVPGIIPCTGILLHPLIHHFPIQRSDRHRYLIDVVSYGFHITGCYTVLTSFQPEPNRSEPVVDDVPEHPPDIGYNELIIELVLPSDEEQQKAMEGRYYYGTNCSCFPESTLRREECRP